MTEKVENDLILMKLGKVQQVILLFMGEKGEEVPISRQDLVKHITPLFRTDISAQSTLTNSLQRLERRGLIENVNPAIKALSKVKLTKEGVSTASLLKKVGVRSFPNQILEAKELARSLEKAQHLIKTLERENKELRTELEDLRSQRSKMGNFVFFLQEELVPILSTISQGGNALELLKEELRKLPSELI